MRRGVSTAVGGLWQVSGGGRAFPGSEAPSRRGLLTNLAPDEVALDCPLVMALALQGPVREAGSPCVSLKYTQ